MLPNGTPLIQAHEKVHGIVRRQAHGRQTWYLSNILHKRVSSKYEDLPQYCVNHDKFYPRRRHLNPNKCEIHFCPLKICIFFTLQYQIDQKLHKNLWNYTRHVFPNKNLPNVENIYKSAACDACDKYHVCYLQSLLKWFFNFLSSSLPLGLSFKDKNQFFCIYSTNTATFAFILNFTLVSAQTLIKWSPPSFTMNSDLIFTDGTFEIEVRCHVFQTNGVTSWLQSLNI